MYTKKCPQCNKFYETLDFRQIYCNRLCYTNHNKGVNNGNYIDGGLDCVCFYCGKKFKVPRHRLSKQAGKYCSLQCYYEKVKDTKKWESEKERSRFKKLKKWKEIFEQLGTNRCQICGKEWREGLKFIRHHVSYSPEIIVLVCSPCHNWMHASATVFRHLFRDAFGKDQAPYIFALKVVMLYEDAFKKYKNNKN